MVTKYIPLTSGIPSHDTLGRFFGALDHQVFSHCFMFWIQEISELSNGEVIRFVIKKFV
nr:transposase family protein [Aquimarina sp. RZ0]